MKLASASLSLASLLIIVAGCGGTGGGPNADGGPNPAVKAYMGSKADLLSAIGGKDAAAANTAMEQIATRLGITERPLSLQTGTDLDTSKSGLVFLVRNIGGKLEANALTIARIQDGRVEQFTLWNDADRVTGVDAKSYVPGGKVRPLAGDMLEIAENAASAFKTALTNAPDTELTMGEKVVKAVNLGNWSGGADSVSTLLELPNPTLPLGTNPDGVDGSKPGTQFYRAASGAFAYAAIAPDGKVNVINFSHGAEDISAVGGLSYYPGGSLKGMDEPWLSTGKRAASLVGHTLVDQVPEPPKPAELLVAAIKAKNYGPKVVPGTVQNLLGFEATNGITMTVGEIDPTKIGTTIQAVDGQNMISLGLVTARGEKLPNLVQLIQISFNRSSGLVTAMRGLQYIHGQPEGRLDNTNGFMAFGEKIAGDYNVPLTGTVGRVPTRGYDPRGNHP